MVRLISWYLNSKHKTIKQVKPRRKIVAILEAPRCYSPQCNRLFDSDFNVTEYALLKTMGLYGLDVGSFTPGSLRNPANL